MGWRRARTAIVAVVVALVAMTSIAVPANAGVTPFPTPVTPTSPPGSYRQQVLAENGDNAIDPVLGKFYRIVALADLGNGVELAAYDGRPDGGDAPSANSIVQRRSTDGGATWGAATYIARGQLADSATGTLKYGFSDPSYVVDQVTGAVFNFHVYSKEQGFGGSALGNDDTNRQVISTEVSVSTDGGLSWSTDPANQPPLPTPSSYPAGSPYAGFAGPLITNVTKPVGTTVGGIANVGGVKGVFAASGEGIQLKYGPNAGRLIQQYAANIIQPNGSTALQAYSVYSDDHGASWTMGAPVGTAMDENKVVELSDGRVMLNSRDSANGHGRKIAISTDGGATYGPVTIDTTLVDPTNNASIVRMFPNAAQGSADAQKLLFSNANSASSRINGTVRYSCDNGATWGTSRLFKSGTMSYSTLTALSDGSFGLLYEGDNNTITFAKFDAAWLSPLCASMTATPTSVPNGGTTAVTFTITNKDAVATVPGTLTLADKINWDAQPVSVPPIDPGTAVTVSLQVTAPSYLKAGAVTLGGVFTAGTATLTAPVMLTVTGGNPQSIVGAAIFGLRDDAGRDLATNPYAAGDQVPYQFHVYHTGNITESVVPQSGNLTPFLPPGAGNCRFSTFNVGGDYLCTTPKHLVTATEAAAGFFVPVTGWQITGTGATTQNSTITGDEVDLKVRNPAVDVQFAAGPVTDVDADGFASVGDTITYTATVTNDGNVALTNVSGVPGVPASDLAVGGQLIGTSTYTLTAADIAEHSVAAQSISVIAANGAKTVAQSATVPAVALNVLTVPTVTLQPQAVTVTSGGTATFVAAASGNPAPTVQWQVAASGSADFSDVAGATSGSFTTPVLTAGDDGSRYRAVFSNSGGNATSDVAGLTVLFAPGAPTITSVTGGDTSATVTFNGGVAGDPAATTFTATATPTDQARPTVTSVPSASPITLTGLVNGGKYTITVTATNSTGSTTSAPSDPVVVGLAPTMDGTTAAGMVGAAYRFQYLLSGAPVPTATVVGGSMPPGLALSATGLISGTPTAAGTFNFTVRASNTVGAATISSTIAVKPASGTKADLRLTVTGPATVAANGTLSYTVKVTNAGPAAAKHVTTTLLMPPGVQFQSASSGYLRVKQAVLWKTTSLNSGASTTFIVKVRATGQRGLRLALAGTASRSTPDPVLLNNLGAVPTRVK